MASSSYIVTKIRGHTIATGGELVWTVQNRDGERWQQTSDKVGEGCEPKIRNYLQQLREIIIASDARQAWKYLCEYIRPELEQKSNLDQQIKGLSDELFELTIEDFPEARQLESEKEVLVGHRFQQIGYLWYLVSIGKKGSLEWRVSYDSKLSREQIVYYWWKVTQDAIKGAEPSFYLQWWDWNLAPYARLGLPPGYPETEATGDQKLGIIIKELHEQDKESGSEEELLEEVGFDQGVSTQDEPNKNNKEEQEEEAGCSAVSSTESQQPEAVKSGKSEVQVVDQTHSGYVTCFKDAKKAVTKKIAHIETTCKGTSIRYDATGNKFDITCPKKETLILARLMLSEAINQYYDKLFQTDVKELPDSTTSAPPHTKTEEEEWLDLLQDSPLLKKDQRRSDQAGRAVYPPQKKKNLSTGKTRKKKKRRSSKRKQSRHSLEVSNEDEEEQDKPRKRQAKKRSTKKKALSLKTKHTDDETVTEAETLLPSPPPAKRRRSTSKKTTRKGSTKLEKVRRDLEINGFSEVSQYVAQDAPQEEFFKRRGKHKKTRRIGKSSRKKQRNYTGEKFIYCLPATHSLSSLTKKDLQRLAVRVLEKGTFNWIENISYNEFFRRNPGFKRDE